MLSLKWFSVLLFALSLLGNGYCLNNQCTNHGLSILLIGWLGLLSVKQSGVLFVLAWYANPFLIFSWISTSLGWRHLALLAGGTALLFGVAFLSVERQLMDEAGGVGKITGYGIGYWLWIASMCAGLAAAVLCRQTRAAMTADGEPPRESRRRRN